MPLDAPINPGKVVWSGENPGILLKQQADGPWSAMALFFRIAYSPAGRGTALLFYEQPNRPTSLPAAANLMLSDNRRLAEYLLTDFIATLPAFHSAPAFSALQHVAITESYAAGDPRSEYREVIKADGLEIQLVWGGLGRPTALELPAELTAGKEHDAFNVLVESTQPQIILNGRVLDGKPVVREQAGIKTTTAFLYFSETWIAPAAD